MANSGKNTNSSQFFFTLRAVSHLNGKHVVFGEVEEGMDVLEELSKVETDKASKPIQDVVISACGEIDASGKDKPSLGSDEIMETKAPSSGPFGFGSGGTPAFGNSNNAFGKTATTFTFGSSSKSAFGSGTKSSFSFGVSTGGTFGSTTGAFGGSNTAPAFGKPSTLGGTSSGGFGATSGSTPSFGGGFGSIDKTENAFGESAPVFGNTSTFGAGGGKTSAPTFGSTSTFAFGDASKNSDK